MNIFRSKLEKSEELEALQAKYDAMETEFTSVKDELAYLREEQSGYQLRYTETLEELATLKAENEQLKVDNAQLSSKHSDVDLRAAEMAVAIVADNIGDEPVEITEDIPEMDIKESLATLKGAELVKYYNQNKAEIFKALKLK